MTGRELLEAFKNGLRPVLGFTPDVNELEMQFEDGMRAKLIDIRIEDDECIKLVLDESKYRMTNELAEHPYYRKEVGGEFIHKYSEIHGRNNVATIYDELDNELSNVFVVEDSSNRLYEAYIESNTDISYVEWLEFELLKRLK